MNESFYETECLPYVKSIAQEIDELADSIDLDELRDRIDELENMDDAEDFIENPNYDPEDEDSEQYVLTEDAKTELEDLQRKLEDYESGDSPQDLYGYFDDFLDVEYRIDGSGEYRSVAITVATGGPHVEVDTGSNSVKLWWGGTQAEWSFSSKAGDIIDDIFSEHYASVR
jgi:hypothetical protein